MNCCNNNKNKENKLALQNGNDQINKKSSKGHMSHMKMMALCCGAPLIFLAAASFIGYKGNLTGIASLICPIMMILMIPMMLKGHGGCHSKEDNQQNVKSIKDKPLS